MNSEVLTIRKTQDTAYKFLPQEWDVKLLQPWWVRKRREAGRRSQWSHTFAPIALKSNVLEGPQGKWCFFSFMVGVFGGDDPFQYEVRGCWGAQHGCGRWDGCAQSPSLSAVIPLQCGGDPGTLTCPEIRYSMPPSVQL